jgi:hypothetical protein
MFLFRLNCEFTCVKFEKPVPFQLLLPAPGSYYFLLESYRDALISSIVAFRSLGLLFVVFLEVSVAILMREFKSLNC